MCKDATTETTENVYNATLQAVANGVPLYILEDFVEYYESQEMYEECAGVVKAIYEMRESGIFKK